MSIKFKLSPNDINQFHEKLKNNKEFGGVLNIHNGKIKRKTMEKGNNYSISYNYKNNDYEFSYHTHAYYPKMKGEKENIIMNLIKKDMNSDLNKALYLFECDIISKIRVEKFFPSHLLLQVKKIQFF